MKVIENEKSLSTAKAKYVLERLFRLTDSKDTVLLFKVSKLVNLVSGNIAEFLFLF